MRSFEARAGYPAETASAAKARRFLERTLRGWQCDHLVDVATLLASELVANAVLHAGSTVEIVARINSDRLRIEVHDDSSRLPVRKRYSTMSATGRGLLLVEQLAEDWGSEATSSGKRVWFELDQAPEAGQKEAELFDLGEFDLEELTPAERQPNFGGRGGGGGGRAPRLRVLSSV